MASEERESGRYGNTEQAPATGMDHVRAMSVTDGRTAHAGGLEADIARWLNPLKRLDEMLHGVACGLAGVCHPRTQVALGVRVMRVQYLLRERTGDLEAAVALFEEGGLRFMAAVDAALRDASGGHPEDGLLRLKRCAPHLERMDQGVQGLRGGLDAVGEALEAAQDAVAETYGLQKATRGETAVDAGASGVSGRPGETPSLGGAVIEGRSPHGACPTNCREAGTPVVAGEPASAEAEHDAALIADLRRLAGATDGAQVEASAARLLCHGRVELARMAGALDDLSRHGQILIEACARLADEIVPAWIRSAAPQGELDGGPAPHDDGRTRAEAQAWAGWQAQMKAMQALREGLHDLLREMGLHYAFNPTPEEGLRAAVEWARSWIELPPKFRLPT